MTKSHMGLKQISIALFFVTLAMLVVHIQLLAAFNRHELSVLGNDSSQTAYMEIDPRANSTSRWLKRDFPLTEDRTVDLTGQTIDETLYNNSPDLIHDWKLRINITGNCFVNQSWNGTVEIHQFVNSGHEAVQTLNLQDYRLEDVKLQYRYDGDLLIPLQKGDYLIYFPNEHYTEMPIRSGDKVTVGTIFYYLDQLDLSDYTLTLHFYRGFAQGWSFIVFITSAALWVLTQAMYAASTIAYRNARKQMELRRSGLSYMSELYEAIYILNLPSGEITPVSPGEYMETLRAKAGSPKELLRTAVMNDADENYLNATLAFVDTDTLPERLKDHESIVHEFVSRLHGWCRFRFFAMDRTEGKPIESVLFAVQDINDERSEVKELADRLEKAQAVSSANSGFLAAASRDLKEPIRELLALDEELLQEKDSEKLRKTAENIRGTANRMLSLLDGLEDRAALEAGNGLPSPAPYSLKQVLRETLGAVQPLAEKKRIRLETEVSESIPDALSGDAAKLRETAVALLSGALNQSTDGAVRLSVFGKTGGDSVHLLFSARAVPESAADAGTPADRKTGPAEPDLNLEVAGSLLEGLGTHLKSVRSPDSWQDRYFEIDQKIADPAPIGAVTVEDLIR